MPKLHYLCSLRLLFALLIVSIPATLGHAIPQDNVGVDQVGTDTNLPVLPPADGTEPTMPDTNTEMMEPSMGDVMQGTGTTDGNETETSTGPMMLGSGNAVAPDNSAPLQLEGFPVRPSFENTTTFPEDKTNYTDPDAPIVESFKNSSDLTTYHIQDREIFGDLPVTQIPVFFSTTANNHGPEPISAGNATSDAIDFAMPQILEQLGVDSGEIAPLVEETSPILTEALMYLLGQSDIPNGTETEEGIVNSDGTLDKRWSCCKGISIKGIGKAVGKAVGYIPEAIKDTAVAAGCSVTAQTALPGYLATYAQVKTSNPGPGIPVTESHMYFLFQLYGYFPQTANLRLHFNTRKFLGFIGEYDAITFGRDIFIVDDYRLSPKPGPSDFYFETTMSTIIHEVRHSQQYRGQGWVIPSFGAKYLYQYCKAGFSYRKLQWEAEAFAQDKLMADLLSDKAGYRFFRYWRHRRLFSALGYPVATTYRREPGTSDDEYRWELPFQYGILQAKFYKDGQCWKYLSPTEAAARDKAINCRAFSGRCEPDTTIYEKAIKRKAECLLDDKY
ncbi:MAG: hypothetical protein Q9169_001348 [Polycauliona sp. 2 TL-2023]